MNQTTPNTSSKLKKLGREISNKHTEAQVTFEIFPSGSASLDVKIHNSFFILEYSELHKFGLSSVPEGDNSWELGHDENFARFSEARAKLLACVKYAAIHRIGAKKKGCQISNQASFLTKARNFLTSESHQVSRKKANPPLLKR